MFTASSDLYDAIYASFKDYAAEAAQIAALIERTRPGSRTVLDVGCGTGEHARRLADAGFLVDGIDLDPSFVRIARQKLPTARIVEADMGDFHLGRSYDAIVCLFSSIGYLRTLDRVGRALACFREHLVPGGVAFIEPWFEPGAIEPGRVDTTTVDRDGVRVSRASRIVAEGRLSRLHFDYEISDASGTRHESEVHELGLFTAGELMRALNEAGFAADYDPQGPIGRGLFTARIPA